MKKRKCAREWAVRNVHCHYGFWTICLSPWRQWLRADRNQGTSRYCLVKHHHHHQHHQQQLYQWEHRRNHQKFLHWNSYKFLNELHMNLIQWMAMHLWNQQQQNQQLEQGKPFQYQCNKKYILLMNQRTTDCLSSQQCNILLCSMLHYQSKLNHMKHLSGCLLEIMLHFSKLWVWE